MQLHQAQALAARLVMVDLPGTELDPDSLALLQRYPSLRAVCLFRKNLAGFEGTRALCRALQQRVSAPALIAIDQEGGAVSRATFVPVAPSAMALGAVDDLALTEQIGAAVARGLRGMGINWNFAPVLDVNNNPANPVIGERSFSERPEDVARLAGAWMRGSLGEGVACCVKHFPGHGDTHEDSHHALPQVDKSLAELEALELIPFRRLASQAPALMTAHIVYPQLDPELPATLSPFFLTELLRQRIGFQGVVITDALMMQAIKARWGHARSAVLALQAGADMVLAQGSVDEQCAAIEAIAQALMQGQLSQVAAERSAARIDALALRFPVREQAYAASAQRADQTLMDTACARALTALRGAQAPQGPLRVITQRAVLSDGVSEAGLDAEQVMALWPQRADIEWRVVDDLQALRAEDIPRDGRCNVLVSNHRARFGAAASSWPIDLHLALWNPFQSLDLNVPTVLSWGYDAPMRAALRAWLAGDLQAQGRAPVEALGA
ncbi:beta-N-acetylhexosaminidase [Inhella inkyongensis]|uniref:Beta-N-acetylhexosaminidase n=1 Tax=Inhella inkyongensis TaxID=392593 RepID=A0A840S7I7_9BURK|nr:beta-N-acetylhexosaminidase [Inhella inkyongensis]MBB5205633.1 beta-N-acetylhexosaminidase [Inhella inkyongensis]